MVGGAFGQGRGVKVGGWQGVRAVRALGCANDRVVNESGSHPSGFGPAAGGSRLPILEKRAEIERAIREHQAVVVCGETGSGKTTQLPQMCLGMGRGRRGMIGHTQPRRIAARSVAARIAEEMGVRLGGLVGYKMRFAEETSGETRIKVMTDGTLLAETQGDPELRAYDTIIIDEAHERSANIDFLLGYLKRLMGRRPELRVIITSATIEPGRIAAFFGGDSPRSTRRARRREEGERERAGISDFKFEISEGEERQKGEGVSDLKSGISDGEEAGREEAGGDQEGASKGGRVVPIIEVSGRMYQVEVRYRPVGDDEDDFEEVETGAVVEAVSEVVRAGGRGTLREAGDVLVFLPGEKEIRLSAEGLRRAGVEAETLPLFSRLTAPEQDRIFHPVAGRQRVILATNVAETSLTVPGIRYVVDTGLARLSRYDHQRRIGRLEIEPISRASADQRAGRCGRVAAGVCVRLYSEASYRSRARFTDPEILRSSLAGVILRMKSLGLEGGIEEFPLLDRPAPELIRDGYETLFELGAISEACGRGRLTEIGRRLAGLPVDVRVGRMLLAGADEGCEEEMLVLAACLSIQDPRERPMERQEEADLAQSVFRHERSDFLTLLNLWSAYRATAREMGHGALRAWCREHFLSFNRMREWEETWRQLREAVDAGRAEEVHRGQRGGTKGTEERRDGEGEGIGNLKFEISEGGGRREGERGAKARAAASTERPREDAVHRALMTGFLSNVCIRDDAGGGKFDYRGIRGNRVSIFPGSALFKKPPKWIVAGEIVQTTRLYARTLAKIEQEWIEELAGHILERSYSDPHFDRESGEACAWERATLAGVPIVARRRARLAERDPRTAREVFIRHALVRGELSPRCGATTVVHGGHGGGTEDTEERAGIGNLEFQISNEGRSAEEEHGGHRREGRGGEEFEIGHLKFQTGGGEGESARSAQARGREANEGEGAEVEEPEIGEWRFLLRNRAVMERARGVEAKLRRRDVVVDEESLVRWFEARLPGSVVGRESMERWLGEAGEGAGQALELGLVDVVKAEFAGAAEGAQFPDVMALGAAGGRGGEGVVECSLEYRLEPGKESDGVTAVVPLTALARLTAERAEWLVPGMVEEKVTALLKLLARQYRGALERGGDLAELAGQCAEVMKFGDGSLGEALSEAVEVLRGVKVPREAWSFKGLPAHLRLAVRVVDEHGKELASGRDVEELRERLAGRMKRALAGLARARFAREGIAQWDFGELPEFVETDRGGEAVKAYPALVDRGESVSLTLMETAEAGAASTAGGVRRLLAIACREEVSHRLDALAGWEDMKRQFRALGTVEELRDSLLLLIAERAFLAGLPAGGGAVRAREEFERVQQAGWGRLAQATMEVTGVVAKVLELRHRIAGRIAGGTPRLWQASIEDMREQAAYLMPRGFLRLAGWEHLREYPRYLETMWGRLAKLREGGAAAETEALREVLPRWKRFTAWVARAMAEERRREEEPAGGEGEEARGGPTRAGKPVPRKAALPQARRTGAVVNVDAGEWAMRVGKLPVEVAAYRWGVEELRVEVFRHGGSEWGRKLDAMSALT
jgi:ATP-dependent helicase HrpA